MKILEVILLMTIVTYGARALPLVMMRQSKVTGFAKDFIELVPVALLAALVIPELIMPDNKIQFLNPYLGAGILTYIFARYVRNLFAGVLFGMLIYWGLDKLLLR